MGGIQAAPSRDKEKVLGCKGHEGVQKIVEGNKYEKYRDQ